MKQLRYLLIFLALTACNYLPNQIITPSPLLQEQTVDLAPTIIPTDIVTSTSTPLPTKILVPTPTPSAKPTQMVTPTPDEAAIPELKIVSAYIFQEGDTIESIASMFGVTVRDLILANKYGVLTEDFLKPNEDMKWKDLGLIGQELNIPKPPSQEKLDAFYGFHFNNAPEIDGYEKVKDNQMQFVYYRNDTTNQIDRAWDIETGPITNEVFGYAESSDGIPISH